MHLEIWFVCLITPLMIFMELIQNVYYRQFFNTKHFICSMYACMLFIFALSYCFPCHLTLTAQKCGTTARLGQMIWQSARVSTCHAICPLDCYGELWFTYNGSLWGTVNIKHEKVTWSWMAELNQIYFVTVILSDIQILSNGGSF